MKYLDNIIVQRKEGLPLDLPPIQITPQTKVSSLEELFSGEQFFIFTPKTSKIIEVVDENLRQNLLHSLPTVKSWYIFPLDNKFRTSVTVSKKENTLKAFWGKWHEKALVECLAYAYNRIGTRSELVVEKSLLSSGWNEEIARFLGISHIPHVEKCLQMFSKIAFDDTQTSLEMFNKIRELWKQKWGRELLTWRLWLGDTARLSKVKKDLEVKDNEDRFKKLIYFEDESIEQIAIREFEEESGYTIQEGSFTPFLRFVEVKVNPEGTRYLKDRLYALGEKWERIKEPSLSQSEKDQGIEAVFDIPLEEARRISEESLKAKFGFDKNGKKTKISNLDYNKRSTVVANYIALTTLQHLINIEHIKGRRF